VARCGCLAHPLTTRLGTVNICATPQRSQNGRNEERMYDIPKGLICWIHGFMLVLIAFVAFLCILFRGCQVVHASFFFLLRFVFILHLLATYALHLQHHMPLCSTYARLLTPLYACNLCLCNTITYAFRSILLSMSICLIEVMLVSKHVPQ
jgi:hypothetical protein